MLLSNSGIYVQVIATQKTDIDIFMAVRTADLTTMIMNYVCKSIVDEK
jgi:hypothetical protein